MEGDSSTSAQYHSVLRSMDLWFLRSHGRQVVFSKRCEDLADLYVSGMDDGSIAGVIVQKSYIARFGLSATHYSAAELANIKGTCLRQTDR